MAILYTQAEVQDAQVRAIISLYLISQQIQNGFYYFYSPVYKTYKDLQYDIYTLLDVVSNEAAYVTYGPNPSTYEANFYNLVGAMINKTKQFDVYGEFGGSVNPNYQPGGDITINVTASQGASNFAEIPFTNQTIVTLADFHTVYYPLYGNTKQIQIFVSDGAGGFVPDFGNVPTYEYTIADDPSSDITSITWGYPVPTSGYISIFGIAPTT